MTITINKKRIQKALVEAQQHAERTNGGWLYLEMIGRCFRYLDNPDATIYFRQAAQNYPLFPQDIDGQMVLANLHRLAGDIDQACQHYQQAYDLLVPLDFAEKENAIPLDRLALCAYMLGDIPLTIKAVTHLRPLCRKDEWLNTFALAGLAEAQQQHRVSRAHEIVQTTETVIRQGRHQVWSEGSMFSPWDAYEEARRVVRVLGGDPDAPPEDES